MATSPPAHVAPPPLRGELSVNDLSHAGEEVWAVGMRGAPGPARIAHTKAGDPWEVAAYSSSSAAVHTQLAGVHAVAAGDVWAVGWEGLFHTGTERPHIAHGDGSTWQPVACPDLGDGSHLSGVAAWAGDDAIAVGARTSTASFPVGPAGGSPVAVRDALAVRWDGARWSAVPAPARGTLHDVCAVGPGNYWAVGTAALPDRPGNSSLVAHFADGQWQHVGSEGTGTLFGVAGAGPDDVWAVGQDQDPGHATGALVLHYDGHAWSPVAVPVAGQAWLTDVACAGGGQVWAVGARQGDDGAVGPLVLHFDAVAWAVVDPPASAARHGLNAVVALPGCVWAAGGVGGPGDTGYPIAWV